MCLLECTREEAHVVQAVKLSSQIVVGQGAGRGQASRCTSSPVSMQRAAGAESDANEAKGLAGSMALSFARSPCSSANSHLVDFREQRMYIARRSVRLAHEPDCIKY